MSELTPSKHAKRYEEIQQLSFKSTVFQIFNFLLCRHENPTIPYFVLAFFLGVIIYIHLIRESLVYLA